MKLRSAFAAWCIAGMAWAQVVEVELPSKFHQMDLATLSTEQKQELDRLTDEAVRRAMPPLTRPGGIHGRSRATEGGGNVRRASSLLIGEDRGGDGGGCGGVIVYTRNGQSWLPQADQVKKAPGLYRAGEASNDLTFTFNSPNNPWSSSELSLLQNTVTLAYPIMRTLMGPPAFANTVNYRKPNSNEGSAFYTSSTNEAVIGFPTVGNIIHEMAHAFRDELGFPTSIPYEEGMARGPEIVVLKQLYGGFYTYQGAHIYYEPYNQWGEAPHRGDITPDRDSAQYEWSAMAWLKCWVEDPGFFSKFHTAYYIQRAQKGTLLIPSELNAVVAQVKPTVEGEATSTWLTKQWMTKYGSQQKGYVLRIGVANSTIQVTPLFSYRTGSAIEEFRAATITVKGYNSAGQMLGQVTKNCPAYPAAGGTFTIQNGGDIDTGSYTWCVKIVASSEVQSHTISATTYAALGIAKAPFFGVVTTGQSGTIDIPGVVSTQVVNGMFQLNHPSLTSGGTFTVRFSNELNQVTTRIITKDASDYFLFPDFTYPAGAPYDPSVTLTTQPPVTNQPSTLPPSLTLVNNLFNPTQGQVVTINWEVGATTPVTVEIRDSTGQLLNTLLNQTQGAGTYSMIWSGQNSMGETVASGVYLACLRTSTGIVRKKIIVIK